MFCVNLWNLWDLMWNLWGFGGKNTILNLEYCIVACFLEFIIISNIIRTLKICKNVRYFMKLSVESYRILEIYCIFAAVMTFNKRWNEQYSLQSSSTWLGLDICAEVIRSYLKKPNRNLTRLQDYAKRLRVFNTLKNYLEIAIE